MRHKESFLYFESEYPLQYYRFHFLYSEKEVLSKE